MDFFNSFFQNVKDKLTSPFFGTLGFVILIHHWEFWYVLFNFSSKTDLHIKISILKTIGAREFHWCNLLTDVFWTIVIMMAGYVIIISTRSLSLFIDFGIMPWVTKKVINKNVVARTEYEDVLKERDYYAEKFEDERKYGRVLSKSYDDQTEEIKKKNIDISSYNDQITQSNKKIELLNFSISEAEKKKNGLLSDLATSQGRIAADKEMLDKLSLVEKNLQFEIAKINKLLFGSENNGYWKALKTFPPTIEKTVEDIKTAGLWQGFKDVVKFEHKGGSIGLQIYTELKPFGILTDVERLNIIGKIIAENMEKFDK